jgi:hypothetical protein
MGIMDTTAIERIAAPDLTSDALALLEQYGTNDDVVFFLGRLVWQGRMTECLPALMAIAGDSSRGKYARIASIRAVMATGDDEQKDELWEAIAGERGPLDRALLAELLDWAPPTSTSVELMLRTLEIVAPLERFKSSGLKQAVHNFVDRLPVMADGAEDQPLGRLIEGLNQFLGREPFIERGECHVSEAFAWLMSSALHAVDKLVAARSTEALAPAAIEIMLNMPALRWRSDDSHDYKSSLGQNVLRWRALNDLLYWTSIDRQRERLSKNDKPLTDDWQVAYLGHFWGFGAEDFERCLDWVRTKSGDDRLVALSRCVHLYVQADRPSAWLKPLRASVHDDPRLAEMLETKLDPKPSPVMQEWEAEHQESERKREAREKREQKDRADWVRALKANPDRVRSPEGLEPGEFANDQYWLLDTLMRDRSAFDRQDGTNWRGLIPDFGEAVARGYRDAAVAHWRAYEPTLRSEGAEGGSTPWSMIFAMAGLSIEADEDSAFAQRLSPDEVRRAFRYTTWELNGFPDWLETLYRAYPVIGLEAVKKELLWELEHSLAERPLHYILHDILYHAPWLHADVAPLILDWLRTHDMPNADGLRYCLNILTGDGVSPEALADLASEKAQGMAPAEQRPRWFALWTDADASAAIPALEAILKGLSPKDASDFAQQFIVALLGDRHGTGTRVGSFRNARDLKTLYILMHRYIRTAEDIDRADKGVYSPTLRDNAQESRNTLFNMLVSVPGAESYAAIRALEKEHPELDYRRWMAVRARERATTDADEPVWTTEQVRHFSQDIADS